MVLTGLAVVLVALALITTLGVAVVERTYRPSGQFIDVAGARLHVVEIGPRSGAAIGPPVVLLHGASANLESMRQPLGELLSARHRVILIDRPGHGFSTRDRLTDATPAIQAAMIDEALGKLGIARAIVVAHSWAGALGAALALDHPARLAGLVLLAPVTHPWNGGVSWYNSLAVTPVAGWLFTRLVALPAGRYFLEPGARTVFAPQPMPAGYVRDTAVALLTRPSEFTANAYDMVALKPAVVAQAPRYHEITTPVVVISGNVDRTVSIDIHSRRFVAAVPQARLIELQGIGHMPQNVAPGVVVDAIDEMISRVSELAAAAAG
jgi:pimeloyl-ACP methyl ester carboxylesterase